MTVQRINFTSSLLDKSRFNKQVNEPIKNEKTEEKSTQEIENTQQENTVEENNTDVDKSETVVSSEQENHTARNWTIGLSAAAVLTGLGVLAGRHGYMGDGIQKMLKGAKKEAGELIDDVSEAVSGGVNRTSGTTHATSASEGTVLGRIEEDAGSIISRHEPEPVIEYEGTVLGRAVDDEEVVLSQAADDNIAGTVLGRSSDDEVSVLGRNSDDLAEQEPLTGTTGIIDDVEEGATVIFPKLDDAPATILSKDGKFKIPMSKDEIDMKATRKYLKAKKVKIPRKYKKLPELKIEDVLGDFKPENVDKTKINGGVYIHQLPKGERLEVHYDWTNNNITYIDRFNSKDVNTGYVGYRRDKAGQFELVELPNGCKYRFNNDNTLAYGERYKGNDSYHYDSKGMLERIDQKISDNVERKIFFEDNGKIDKVNYYVSTTEGQKLVKEDVYYHEDNTITEFFDVNGDENNYICGKDKSISLLRKLKFWQNENVKRFFRALLSAED